MSTPTETFIVSTPGTWKSLHPGHRTISFTPPTFTPEPYFSHIDERNRGTGVGYLPFDTILRTAIGGSGRVGTFIHGYSGSSLPANFEASSVATANDLGIGAMLNVKRPWTALAAGTYDAAIATFFNSWPVGTPGSVTINHEPENDTENGGPGVNNPATPGWIAWATTNGQIWKDGINRFIDVAAPIIRSRGLNVKVGGCLMAFSWDTTSWSYWNWWDEITPANINEVSFQTDIYARHNADGTSRSLTSRRATLLAEARSVGIGSYEEYETNIDRRKAFSTGATITGTEATCTAWWNANATELTSIPEARMICAYHTPGGPASDQAWFMGTNGAGNTGGEIAAYANICANGRQP